MSVKIKIYKNLKKNKKKNHLFSTELLLRNKSGEEGHPFTLEIGCPGASAFCNMGEALETISIDVSLPQGGRVETRQYSVTYSLSKSISFWKD